jgi:hypothetical protein
MPTETLTNKRYAIIEDGTAIQCLKCNAKSRHPLDIAQRYCGNCHVFHDDLGPPRNLTDLVVENFLLACGLCQMRDDHDGTMRLIEAMEIACRQTRERMEDNDRRRAAAGTETVSASDPLKV